MPYKDPEKQREARRQWYNRRYAEDAAFREAEAARKAEWLEGNETRRETMAEFSRKYRKRKAKE